MKTVLLFAAALLLLCSLGGCAGIVMPYTEKPLCSKGVVGGYCGSITDVYDATTAEMKQAHRMDKKTNCASGNCSGEMGNTNKK